MKHLAITALVSAIVVTAPAVAQNRPTIMASPQQVTLPINTLVEVTPANEITSIDMKEGTTRQFLVTRDVAEQGVVFIPRGSLVTAEVTWRTGKGIIGKSAKFELTFRSVRVAGQERLLRGMHRQEGRGNTAGALLGAAIITGKSAVMYPGQIVNVFTAEPIVWDAAAVLPPPVAASVPYAPRPPIGPRKQQQTGGVRCVTCRD